MQITRKATWDAFDADWCPQCAKVVAMEQIHTGLPGIAAKKCQECGAHYQANYLEDADDMMTVPNWFVMPNAALRGDSGLIAGVPLESTVMQQEVEK